MGSNPPLARPLAATLVRQPDDPLDRPQLVRHARGHRRGDAKALVPVDEIVVHVVQRDGVADTLFAAVCCGAASTALAERAKRISPDHTRSKTPVGPATMNRPQDLRTERLYLRRWQASDRPPFA